MCGVTREPVNKQRASCFIQHGKFLFLGSDGSVGRKSTLKVLLPLWGSSEPPTGPGSSAQELGKPNKQTDPCPHSLSCSDVSISRLAGCWEVGSCHQTTSISSAQRVSSLAVSANEMHSWDWQAAVVPRLIDACVPLLRNLGKQENLRSVPELDLVAPRQLPSTECIEEAQMHTSSLGPEKSSCTSAFPPSSPPAPAELFPLALLPPYTQHSSDPLPPQPSCWIQLQAVTQKDGTSEKRPDALAISVLPGIRWIAKSAGSPLSGLPKPASCPAKTPL